MSACCRQCGRRIRAPIRGLCRGCENKRLAAIELGVTPIQNPTDDEMEFIYDNLIRQRAKKLRVELACQSDDPAEERKIRERLGV